VLTNAAVSEGYKVKQTIFPTETQRPETVSAPPPTNSNRAPLKRSRSDNGAELEEEYSATPTLVVSSSYNSYTTDDGDWEEPEWLLPQEVVCVDVEMGESK
jgi:hypothetical protein